MKPTAPDWAKTWQQLLDAGVTWQQIGDAMDRQVTNRMQHAFLCGNAPPDRFADRIRALLPPEGSQPSPKSRRTPKAAA